MFSLNNTILLDESPATETSYTHNLLEMNLES